MFCKNCGTELEDNMAFCPECGTKAEVEPACEVTAAPAAEEIPAEDTAADAEVAVVQEDVQEIPCEAEDCAQAEDCSPAEECTCDDLPAEEIAEANPEAVEEASAEPSSEDMQPASDFAVVPLEFAEETPAPAKKTNKLLISIIAIVVMVALVATGFFVVPKFLGGNYEDVAKNYGLAYAEADLIEASKYCLCSYVEAYDKMVDYSCEEYDMTREEFFEILSDEYGDEIVNIEQLFVIMKEEAVTYLQEEYGNYTISARIADAEEMSAESIAELKEYIAEDQGYDYPSMFDGVDADKITAGYIVEVELTINGSESTDTESQEVTVVKYGGKWKAIGE